MRSPSLIALATLSACGVADRDPSLEKFASCDEMKSYMADMALREGQYAWAVELSMSFGMSESSIMTVGADSAGSYSTTNLQEQGVDEADLVKTDGTWIYGVANGQLAITRAWPTEDAALESVTDLDGVVEGIYLDGDTVIALSSIPMWEQAAPRSGVHLTNDEDRTLVTVIDVTDRAAPVVVRETYTSGLLSESRRIGDHVFVVTYQDLRVDDMAQTWGEAKEIFRKAEARDWLPRRVDNRLRVGAWETEEGDACACTDVWRSDALGGTFQTNVMSLDLANPDSDFVGEAVVGRADTIYASPQNLYVAYTQDDEGSLVSPDGQADTILHKFALQDADRPTYQASAQILGKLPDQFALSELDGVLRVATTEVTDWTTMVWTLGDDGAGGFDQLDVERGIAPGEDLFSSRFVGDVGYLVTYIVEDDGTWQPGIVGGDPLFTLDLSDPYDIRVLGELVLDGWSDYIHPMAEDRLLTVGIDRDDQGRDVVSVSLFDVSDLTNPRLHDRLLLESVSSEAQLDHHAFNFFPDLDVLALPSTDFDWNTGLDVIHADRDGLASLGRMQQTGVLELADEWCAPVRRSVFLEDQIWALSDAGLTASVLDDPSTVVQAIPFGIETCGDEWGW